MITRTRLSGPSLTRRSVLAGMLAYSTGAWAAGAEQAVPNSTGSAPPRLNVPADGCDCHHHIYDARFPASPHWHQGFPPGATVANYRRWAQVVEDIVADLRSRPLFRNKKIGLAGQSQGASVALIAATRRLEVEALAEWSGLLPNEFFSQVQAMPPLLILHGEVDEQVPIVNARQLVRLCQLRDFTCEIQIFAGEGHVFAAHVTDSANQRALAFFRVYLH